MCLSSNVVGQRFLSVPQKDPAIAEFIIFKCQTHIPYSSSPIPSLMSFIDHTVCQAHKHKIDSDSSCWLQGRVAEHWEISNTDTDISIICLEPGITLTVTTIQLCKKKKIIINKKLTVPFYLPVLSSRIIVCKSVQTDTTNNFSGLKGCQKTFFKKTTPFHFLLTIHLYTSWDVMLFLWPVMLPWFYYSRLNNLPEWTNSFKVHRV